MSVYGLGKESDLPNWNATGLRLLEVAAAFGDIVFALNEVGAKKGRRAQTYEGLRDLGAQYAEGSDRDRHSSHTKDHGGVTRRFHGICISTAEHSISEYAELAGEVRDGGELFRAIDVSAIRKREPTIFDLAPPNLDPLAELQELRKAMAECHGTAWTPYIEYLIEMGPIEVKRQNSGVDQRVCRPYARGRPRRGRQPDGEAFRLALRRSHLRNRIWRLAVDECSRARCSYARLPRRCRILKAGRSACNGTRHLKWDSTS